MKKEIFLSFLILVLTGTLFFSGCISFPQEVVSNQDMQVVTGVPEETMAVFSEESQGSATGTPAEISACNESVSKAYVPLWPAGTLLSDEDRKGWGLITEVNIETSEYYFRNVLYPEKGEPYIIKDSTYMEMGTSYPAKGIDKKYINFEGKIIKIPIVSKTGSSILGYLEYNDNTSMKHTVGE